MTEKVTKAKRIAVYMDADKAAAWQEVVARYGDLGDSATIRTLIVNEIRRVAGDNTKEQRLERIEEKLDHLDAKLSMLLYMAWATLAAAKGTDAAKISADEVRELRATIAAVMADE